MWECIITFFYTNKIQKTLLLLHIHYKKNQKYCVKCSEVFRSVFALKTLLFKYGSYKKGDVMSEKEKQRQAQKQTCEEMYVVQNTSAKECALKAGVSLKTVYQWIKKGNWNAQRNEMRELEKQINLNTMLALNRGLKRFTTDPYNKDLQGLVSLLKHFKVQNKPPAQYKDYVMQFLDHTVDYFLETDPDIGACIFKKNVYALAEYLIDRA